MTANELVLTAAETNQNPYFLAYALATGAADVRMAWLRDGNGARYIGWNTRCWVETRTRLGVGREASSLRLMPDHLETLAAKVSAASPVQPEQMELFA
ncbi:hypothetical protein ACI2KH_20175 [Roseomonas mucosa]|uniref:hypothetical protein n=1 Tax=Roseomonas mucosa TaxID=207340 RepID=UPI00384B835F